MERFKFNTFPLRKCGAVPIAASSISALAGIYNANSANRMQQENIEMQREENQKNRDFQAEQAELARNFTTDERIAQQLYQSEQWQHQFDAETRVQSPAYQAGQLQAAGINPAVYFSRSSAFQGGQSPSVSAPSGAQSPLPQGSSGLSSIAPIVPQFPQLISSAADLLGSIAQSKKVGAEIPEIEAQTKLYLSQVLGQQLMNEAQEFENFLKVQKAPHEIQKLVNECNSEYALIALRVAQGEEYKETAKLRKAEQALTKALENYHGANKDYIIEQTTQLKNSYGVRMRNLESQSYRNYQEGNYYKESAEDKKFWNNYNSENKESLVSRLENEVRNTGLSAEGQELLNKELQFTVDKQELVFWHDLIASDIKMVVDGILDYTKLGAFKNLSEASKKRVENRMEQLKLEREKFEYGKDTYQHTESWTNNYGHKVIQSGRKTKTR